MEDPLEKGLVPIGDDGVILLGAPLGSAEFVGGEIEKKFSFSDLQYFWKTDCISFQYAFSDFQNFLQSDLYFISMYKRQGLFYHHLAPLGMVANLATRWRHLPFASRFVLHFNVQIIGSILKAGAMF